VRSTAVSEGSTCFEWKETPRLLTRVVPYMDPDEGAVR
jgi:hypothetical protein